MSIPGNAERSKQLRRQCAYFIEGFLQKPCARQPEKQSLLHYASMLKTMDGNTFSFAMFRYVLKKRKLIFHYKKKTFVIFSHLKHAFRMAWKGIL
jgi:hypothetical protein